MKGTKPFKVSSACRASQDKQLRGSEREVWSLGEKPETQIWVFGAEVAPSSRGSWESPGELWARVESPLNEARRKSTRRGGQERERRGRRLCRDAGIVPREGVRN